MEYRQRKFNQLIVITVSFDGTSSSIAIKCQQHHRKYVRLCNDIDVPYAFDDKLLKHVLWVHAWVWRNDCVAVHHPVSFSLQIILNSFVIPDGRRQDGLASHLHWDPGMLHDYDFSCIERTLENFLSCHNLETIWKPSPLYRPAWLFLAPEDIWLRTHDIDNKKLLALKIAKVFDNKRNCL